MDIAYKLRRIERLAKEVGWLAATAFEFNWSLHLPIVRVRFPEFQKPFVLRRFSSDIKVFETVFLDKEFTLDLPQDTRLIIDGGANIGLSSAYFANNYPNATIIAVEPDSENFEQLSQNCSAMDNVKPVLGGLWSSKTHLRIANPEAAKWALSCEPANENDENAFEAHTVDDLIEHAGGGRCDLLKLDIEGGEDELFSKNTAWLEKVDRVLVEVHTPKGLSIIENACPKDDWDYAQEGEKLYLQRHFLKPAL